MSTVEKYQKQVEENPNDADAWYRLGDAYSESELHEEALDAFEKASLIDPQNIDILCRLGDVAYFLELYQEAITALSKAVEITSDNPSIWCRLGDAYFASGVNNQYHDPVSDRTINFYDYNDDYFYSEAIFCYEKALAITPANENILKSLIIACSKLRAYYIDEKPDNEDMLKALKKASDYLAQYGAQFMVQRPKISVPQISPEKQEEQYLSFKAMIESWLLPKARNQREVDILMCRMGWSNEDSKTLQEIGTLYGLTRERVRQIESNLMPKLKKKRAISELLPLWSAINVIVESFGILDLYDLGQQLMDYFQWDSKPSSGGLENIISLHPEPFFTLVIEDGNRFLILKTLTCIKCNPISEYFVTCLQGGKIGMTSAMCAFDLFCKAKCNSRHQKNINISPSFIRYLIRNNEYLRKYLREDKEAIYTIDLWNLLYGGPLDAAEAILKFSGRAMHFSEIADKLREVKRNDFLARNVHAALDRSNAAILWGRGTFIHKEHIHLPTPLLENIENWIGEQLKRNIPLVSVFGAFNNFRQESFDAGIPNEVALYSCLRMSADPKFLYPAYPNIYLSTNSQLYSSFSAIENFIHDAGGPISMEEIRRYAITDLGLKEFQLTNALDKNTNILRSDKGEYIHGDYLNIDKSKLNEIVSYIKKILSSEKHVSIERIFQDKIIDCKLMGVNDPVLLFSVLQLNATDIGFNKYPQICSVDAGEESINRGIISAIVDYIKRKQSFCTHQELYEYYVDELGYAKNTVYFVLNHYGIYRYLQGCVIHEETLVWTGTKQSELEEIALIAYEEALNVGRCYGLISDLIESPNLPSLGNNIDWTELLIAELLKKHGNFKIIGNAKRVYVPTVNSKRIESLEDLIYEILKSKYKGSANLNDFTEELVSLGIIIKAITASMLGESQKVCIVGQEIVLTELIRNA